MIETDDHLAAHGPKLMGAHKGLEFLAHDLGNIDGHLEPIVWDKDVLAELADSPWTTDGALERVLDAVCGNLDAPSMSPEAICNRLFELRRFLNPEFEPPSRFKAHKATRSRARKQFFNDLGIAPIPSSVSMPPAQRANVSKGVSEWWKKKKGPDKSPTPETDAEPQQSNANDKGDSVNSSEDEQ